MGSLAVKRGFAMLLIIAVNYLFNYKYALRYTDMAAIWATALAGLQVFFLKNSIALRTLHKYRMTFLFVLTTWMIALVIFVTFWVDLESLQVDRHSVVSAFIDALVRGEYPYAAQSHLGNPAGPMPIYFLLAAPFYFTGALCVLSAAGYWVVSAHWRERSRGLVIPLLFACVSILLWEVWVRSNIFSFSLLALLALEGYSRIDKQVNASFYWSAILCGLALSTRSVFILAFIVYFLSSLRLGEVRVRNILSYLGVMLLAFGLTFLPFVLGYGQAFWELNPFIVQSSFLVPAHYIIYFVLIAICLALMVRNAADRLFYSGLSLFLAIAIYAGYQLRESGYQSAYIESGIDISYFIFGLPFFIAYLVTTGQHATAQSER